MDTDLDLDFDLDEDLGGAAGGTGGSEEEEEEGQEEDGGESEGEEYDAVGLTDSDDETEHGNRGRVRVSMLQPEWAVAGVASKNVDATFVRDLRQR